MSEPTEKSSESPGDKGNADDNVIAEQQTTTLTKKRKIFASGVQSLDRIVEVAGKPNESSIDNNHNFKLSTPTDTHSTKSSKSNKSTSSADKINKKATRVVEATKTNVTCEKTKMSLRKLAKASIISNKWSAKWDKLKSFDTESSGSGKLGGMVSTKASLVETNGRLIEDVQNGHEICRMEDSPFYAHRVSSAGRLEELQGLLQSDPSRALARDQKNWTCMHHAAKRNRTAIIDLLRQFGGDIDATDDDGRSPLHVAVEHNRVDAVRHLLMLGANGNARIKYKQQSVLHIAAKLDHAAVIDALAEFGTTLVDMNAADVNGGTALHVAASGNCVLSAEALLRGGTKLCIACYNGFFPMHEAAKSASTGVLEVMLSYGEKLGYTREHMLGFCDLENNAPLHAAVNSGDIEVVRILLNVGARVDSRQSDQSTAFHLACSQGTTELVRLMYDAATTGGDAAELLAMTDCLGMTPLHRAAMFDHAHIVQFLIDKGANVNAVDLEHRSALMLAALRCGSSTMRLLYDGGADITIRDKKEQNLLHYIVNYAGAQLTTDLTMIAKSEIGRKLLNERDSETGCTPLHLASRRGQLAFLDQLLMLGATLNTKNNDSQSPLHFAAKYGRVGTVRRLLETPQGACVINETDHMGMTALHIASMNGHEKVVQLLLSKGALLHRDYDGCTSLHLAARNGYTQTMRLLLAFHHNLLDLKDKRGNTALHTAAITNASSACDLLLSSGCLYTTNNDGYTPLDYCIEERHVETASKLVEHDRWREIVTFDSKPFVCPLLGLIQNLPEVEKLVLDNCCTKSNADPTSKDYWEKFDFRYLQLDIDTTHEYKKQGKPMPMPLLALNMMVKYGRVDLLSHPVCLKYLNMKWRAYGAAVNFVTMLVYFVYIITLTVVVACFDPRFMRLHGHIRRIVPLNQTSFVERIAPPHTSLYSYDPEEDIPVWKWPLKDQLGQANMLYSVPLFVLLVLLTGNIIKELVQIWMQRLGYFFDVVNYTEWLLYITSASYVYPIVMFDRICDVQWRCAAIAIFLAWFNLLMYLQRWDSVGIYVVMFLEIMKTVFKVTAVFSVLFVAFGMTFYILLASSRPLEPLTSPFLSVLESVTMMLGDLRFGQLYSHPYLYNQLLYPALNFFFVILFVLMVPVLFINLLIGLAVGDIEMVQKNAKLRRLAMQVEYHTELEDRWLPYWMLKRIDKKELNVYPNALCGDNKPLHSLVTKIKDLATSSVVHLKADGNGRNAQDHANYVLMNELEKSKKRIRGIQCQLDRQTELLRLIVQKMEISDQNEFDVGVNLEKHCPEKGKKKSFSKAEKN